MKSHEHVILEIARERERQIKAEGWSPGHDDRHVTGELAAAAGCYAIASARPAWRAIVPAYWPWDAKWWKPKNPRCDLVRAAALIVAEIERLDRAVHQ